MTVVVCGVVCAEGVNGFLFETMMMFLFYQRQEKVSLAIRVFGVTHPIQRTGSIHELP